MNTVKSFIGGFSVIALAAATGAAAQEEFSKLGKDGREYQTAQRDSAQQSQSQSQQLSIRHLIGKKVSDSRGEQLGEINDVVLDLQNGKVHAVVLEFGGKLGVGEEHYAFPMTDLKPGKRKDQLMLNVEKQKLKNADGFAKGQWPELDSEYWGRVGGQASTGASKGQGMALVRARKIRGQNLKDKNGEEVGEIKDIMVDLDNGQIGDIVVDVKDAGQAKVPPEAIVTDTGAKLFLNMDAKELRSQATQAQQQEKGASGGANGSRKR